ncbi:MAG: patatin-like phospholipase family protein [Chitinophagaceae bacterium]|nr:patatin-like phospholipase family protein [Chitinophagaceae bacterium]
METKSFKILSIDGGGIRGLIPAKLLSELEKELKANDSEFRLHTQFDLICGTSTGAILAIGIALGIPTIDLVHFYKNHASDIFPQSYLKVMPRSARAFITSIYTNRTLREKLKEIYTKANGGTIPLINDLKTKVCIPTFNGNDGEINVLKTRHREDYARDYRLPAHEVALSSASAPLYFPPNSFTYVNEFGSGANLNMVDGGIFANNPAFIGILEATEKLNIEFSDIKILSLGTGKGKHIIKRTWLPKNFWYWFVPKPRLLEIILDSQSQITDQYIAFLQRTISKRQKSFDYLRIQYEFDKDAIALNASGNQSLQRLEAIADELSKKNIYKIKNFLNQ